MFWIIELVAWAKIQEDLERTIFSGKQAFSGRSTQDLSWQCCLRSVLVLGGNLELLEVFVVLFLLFNKTCFFLRAKANGCNLGKPCFVVRLAGLGITAVSCR